MDRMNSEEIRDYMNTARLQDLPVSRLLDFHYDVSELKDYCIDLLDCFNREQRYDDESTKYAEICSKETCIIEDMGILLKKIIDLFILFGLISLIIQTCQPSKI